MSIGSLGDTIEVAETLRDDRYTPWESASVAIAKIVVTFLVYAKHPFEHFEMCDFKLVLCCALRDVVAVWFNNLFHDAR